VIAGYDQRRSAKVTQLGRQVVAGHLPRVAI
jgi:hypothetical protein